MGMDGGNDADHRKGKDVKMSETNATTDAVVETEATDEAVSYDVRQRKGKKGPGTHVVTVATQGEAEEIKGILEAEAADGVQTIIRPNPAVVILTVEQFKANREAEANKAKLIADAKAQLTPEQIEAIGL